MEWVVVAVVVGIALLALVIVRRRAIEGETHARETAPGRGEDSAGDRE
jgi:hypothetical protein